MNTDVRLHCPNCGTDFAAPSTHAGEPNPTDHICPVCQFTVTGTPTPAADAVSFDDLQAQLDAVLAHARSAGVPPDDITRVLRDELEFHAELAHEGHRFVVQVIDLGRQSPGLGDTVIADGRDLLQTRGQPIDKSN